MKKKDIDTKDEPKPPTPSAPDHSEAIDAMQSLNTIENPADSLPADFDPSKVATVATAREEAKGKGGGLTKDLLDREVVFVSWRAQRGMIVATGEYKPGFSCVIMDVETKRVFTVWLGNVALCRDLRKLKPPFRAKIVARGRTLVFE